MNHKTITNAVSTLAFSLINILFLLCHFSYWGCASVAAIMLFYVIKVNVLGRKNETYGITEWLGTYLGGLAIDAMFILALEEKLFETTEPRFFGEDETLVYGALAVLIIGSIFLRAFHVNGISISKPQFYMKNILLAVITVVTSGFFIEWEFNSIIYFVLAIVVAGMMIDAFAQHKTFITSGFISAYLILLVFVVACSQYGNFAISLVDRMMNYALFGCAEWYYYIGAALLFFGCALHSHMLNKDSRIAIYDVRVYIWLISASLMIWFLNIFYTPYNPVFLIIYGAVNIVFLFPNHAEKKVTFFGYALSSLTLKYSFVLVLSMVLPISFYYGWLLEAVCVFVAGIGLCAVGSKHENNKQISKITFVFENAYFWYYLLVSCAVFSAVVAFVKSNFVGNYVMIAFATVFAVFASIALTQTNRLSPKVHYIMQGVVVVSTCLFMIFSVNQANFDLALEIETERFEGEEYRVVSINAECENDDFSGECYWTSDPETCFELGDDELKIPYQNGCLKILLKTDKGVSAEYTRFFFDVSEYEPIEVGHVIEKEQYSQDLGNRENSELSLGNTLGSRCYGYDLPIATADGFSASYVDPTATGKVTVLLFWNASDVLSVDTLEHLANIADDFGNEISVFAIHSNSDSELLPSFIDDEYSNSNITFLCDKGNERYHKMLDSSQTRPFVLVLDENGIICKKLYGYLTYKDIENAVKNAQDND